MTVTLNYAPADLELLRAQATAINQSVEDYIMKASLKSAHNAEYLAKIDLGIKQMHEGTGTLITDEQLEALANGHAI